MKLTLSITSIRDVVQKKKYRKENGKQISDKTEKKANSIDPDGTALEPSHQDLHCLQEKNLFRSAGLKGLRLL